ncbi:MAG TPA: energy transducer TonB [Candidatus Solibacter sp.]|nr:energy transducer TonB [Candidatus Solibacter sp.]
MTAATAGPSGPNLFSMFSEDNQHLYRSNRETFLFSLLGQGLLLALVVFFAGYIIHVGPKIYSDPREVVELPLIFSGFNGGGGGNHDKLPASHGDLPQAAQEQIVPPTTLVPTEMHTLMVQPAVIEAPDVVIPQGGPMGDPLSKFSTRSDGPGGPGGIGPGCCDGVGASSGPHFGNGAEGIHPAGVHGVTVPQVIFNPEPSFSDEARKAKVQGVVVLYLVVGTDGKTYNIRVRQSLGMGLDEKAIEAVKRWRFKPAMLDGEAVATEIGVQVDFHLY